MKEKKLSNMTKNLLLFILIITVGFGLILTGFLLNNYLKGLVAEGEKYSPAFYIYLLEIGGAILFLLSFGYLYSYLQEKLNLKKMNIKQMAVIGIFGALSVILYYFAKFPLPIFPSWLDIQFSDVPALIVSFIYGPISGALVILVRFFCKLPGTATVGVGEMADLLIGLAFVLVAGIIYKKHRTLKGALVATTLGIVAGTTMGVFANWALLIPAYKGIAGYPQFILTKTMDTIISGNQGVVTDENFMAYYLWIGVLPFNLVRYAMVFVITFLLYKSLSRFISFVAGSFHQQENTETEDVKDNNPVLEDNK